MTELLSATLAITAGAMVLLWIVSLVVRDASIADVFWGVGFVIVAWTAFLLAPGDAPRRVLVCSLTTLWGVRLAAFLAIRNLGHGEDRRYRAMREHHGARFPLVSLVTVFLLQAVLLWTISLPVQAVQLSPASPWHALDAIGVATFSIGFAIEAVADAQLLRWKRDPAHARSVMDRGLWAWSRHPNYFGEMLVWWGIGAVAVAAGAFWSLVGPLTITMLLVKVSGVPLLEKTIAERRPGYREYVERTSALVPWPPKRRDRS